MELATSDTDGDGSRPPDLRTDAERDAFAAATCFAAANDLASPPETAYLDVLPAARRDILGRLVGGLVRDAPPGLPDPVVFSTAAPAADLPPPVADLDGAALLERAPFPDGCERAAVVPFPASGVALVAPIAAVHGFDRYRVAHPVTAYADGDATPVTHPVDLVPALAREDALAADEHADALAAELAESAANLALARLAARARAARTAAESPLPAPVEGADAAASLERLVTEGHPFHPSAKVRRGMTATEGLSYAPEFAPSIDVRFAAVATDVAFETQIGAETLTDRLLDAFDGLAAALERSLPAGRDPDEYAVVPVHPWQFYRELPTRYAAERADGHVIRLHDYARPATPLLNLRTVVPYPDRPDEPLPHLKLAIGVQATNAERTLSPHAVHNGVRTTRLIDAVVATAPLETLGILREPAATCYYPPDGPHVDGPAYDAARHLSGLLRENPYTHPVVADGADLVPAASLVADSPATGRPVVAEIVDRYAEATDTTAPADATAGFLEAYLDAVVPDQLLLLSAFGVALESHLQNSYVIFEGGRPTATLVRDFGGIRVHHGRLADRGLGVESYPDSDLDAADRRDLYDKLYYALFQNHLSELVLTLARHTPVDEAACWALVRERCEAAFDRVRAVGDVPEARVDRDRAALFGDAAVHKALTAMRLQDKGHEYVTSRVSNPLAIADDESRRALPRHAAGEHEHEQRRE